MKARYLLLAFAVLSCAEPSAPPSPPPPPQALFGWPLPLPPTGLLNCTPLAADSVTQTIGPEGGTIQVGVNTLSIPAGALDTAVTITAVAPSDTLRRVHFEPAGLTFLQPTWLTMSYADCNLLGSLLPKRIAYTSDDLLQILEYLPSWDDLTGQTVTGQLRHFSDYALSW
ncbi:MAG TPA: hypothetical protein VGQ25_06330 [Gemmatimonadales bacterium]|nr:hypothetical protein [Gemmatimonadales bacterium]